LFDFHTKTIKRKPLSKKHRAQEKRVRKKNTDLNQRKAHCSLLLASPPPLSLSSCCLTLSSSFPEQTENSHFKYSHHNETRRELVQAGET
jgi:hypothetical protein